MHKFFRKLDRAVARPFEFFRNFTYYLFEREQPVRVAWQMAGKVVK